MELIEVSWDEAYLPGIHREDGKTVQYNIWIPSLFEWDEIVYTRIGCAGSDSGVFHD